MKTKVAYAYKSENDSLVIYPIVEPAGLILPEFSIDVTTKRWCYTHGCYLIDDCIAEIIDHLERFIEMRTSRSQKVNALQLVNIVEVMVSDRIRPLIGSLIKPVKINIKLV